MINDFSLVQLRTKLAEGDTMVYQQILEHCGHYCIKQLMRKTTCSYEEAEDFLMDAILIFRDKMINNKLQELKSIRAYIYTICWNKWNEGYRNQKKRKASYGAIIHTFYQPEQSIEQKIIEQEELNLREEHYQSQLSLSKQALIRLGEKCQRILKLYYAQEKSMADIAQIMGYANGQTVKNLKSRCYKKWIAIAHELEDNNYGK